MHPPLVLPVHFFPGFLMCFTEISLFLLSLPALKFMGLSLFNFFPYTAQELRDINLGIISVLSFEASRDDHLG